MYRLVPLFILLAACASPSLEFQGAASKSLTIGGDEITVFYLADKAQAIRTNYRKRKQQGEALVNLVRAIEVTTDCKVKQRSIKGDTVLITASLRC